MPNTNGAPNADPNTTTASRIGINSAEYKRRQIESKLNPSLTGLTPEQQELVLDLTQVGLSVVGIFDPTGLADGADALLSLGRKDYWGAGISALGIIPYLGDLAKIGKLPKLLKVIEKTVDVAKQSPDFAKVVRPLLENLKGALSKLPLDKLPNWAKEPIQSMKNKIDEFFSAAKNDSNATKKRIFEKQKIEGDPAMPAGYGETDKYGNVKYSTQGTPKDIALVKNHEKVHQILSPKLKFLREFRADLNMTAYQKSSLCRYLEEAMAESYAQLRVNGIKALPEGIKFPITNGYVQLKSVITEAAIGTVLVGGITYGVYTISDKIANQK